MIIIPAQMEGFRTLKDKTLKVTFETNELNPQELLGIAENINTFGYLAFKKEPFGEKEKEMLENLESDYIESSGKTPSKRLRGVLFKVYESNPEGFKSFATFYDHYMEKIIEHYKTKI